MANGATAAIDFAPAIEGFTRAFVREREAKAQREARTGQVLFEAAKADPTLFDDPTATKAMAAYIGDKDAFQLVRSVYQNMPTAEKIAYEQAKAMGIVSPEDQAQIEATEQQAQQARAINAAGAPPENPLAAIARGAIGAVPLIGQRAATAVLGPPPAAPRVPVPQPYAGAKEAVLEAGKRLPGVSARMTEKGGTAVTVAGPTRREADEKLANQAAMARIGELRAENPGLGRTNAMIQVAREVFQAASAEGVIVPKWIESLATGESENVIKLGLEEGKKQLDAAYAATIAAGTETGRRLGAQAVPQTPEEAAARAVREARTPEGQPLPAGQQAGALQSFREEFARGKAYATGAGTAQAALERDARKAANELFSLNDTLANFAPIAATVLTSTPLRAKAGVQKLKLYLESGQGQPGIAGLRNLQGLLPRITRLVGGDVGNLAIQEQAAYRSIVDGTWQTQQEFVTNMLTLSMGMDRLARTKAEVLGQKPPKSGTLRQALESYRKRYPAIDAAIQRFDEALGQVPDADLKARLASSLGQPEAAPAGAAPSALDLGDGFSLVPVQ